MSGINFSSDLVARYRQLFAAAPAAQAKTAPAAPAVSAAATPTPTVASTAAATVSGFALPSSFRFDSQYAGQILAAQGVDQASIAETMLRYRQALQKSLDINPSANTALARKSADESDGTSDDSTTTNDTGAVDGSTDGGTDTTVQDTNNTDGGGDTSQNSGDGSGSTGDTTGSTGDATGTTGDNTGDTTGDTGNTTGDTGDTTGNTGDTSGTGTTGSTGDTSNTDDTSGSTDDSGDTTGTDTGDGSTTIDPGQTTTSKATAQDALDSLMADIEADADPMKRVARAIFDTIAPSGGAVTASTLVNAVTANGGSVDSANALYAELDPNGTGRVTEQQFMQNFNLNQITIYSMDQISVQPAFFAVNALAQNVPVASLMQQQATVPTPAVAETPTPFGVIDANGDGIATKAEVADVVTSAGGTMADANALYATLDTQGTGAVTAQQFYNNAPIPAMSFYDPFSGVYIDTGPATPAQDGISSVYQAVASENDPVKQFTRGLYERLDANGDNNLTKTEVEQGVMAAGGSRASADALYAQINTKGSGSVTERQFAAAVPQPALSAQQASTLTAAMQANPPASSLQTAASTAATTSAVNARMANAMRQLQSILNG